MAKLFSVKLANLENEMKDLKLNNTSASSISKIQELESKVDDALSLSHKVDEIDNKLNQMVDELTEILNQHANAIKELTKINQPLCG